MNFVYFTDKFRKEIKNTPHEDILYRRIKELEKCTDLSNLNSVDAYRKDKVIVYKLLKTYTSRVIILINKINIQNQNIDFLFVVEYVPKSSFSYKWGNVIHPSLLNGSWIEENEISNAEIENAKLEYLETISENEIAKIPPPSSMTEWLNKFSAEVSFDIFEYEGWVKYSATSNQSGIEERYELFFKRLILAIVQNNLTTHIVKEIQENLFTVINKDDDIGILYSIHQIPEKNTPVFVIRNGAHILKQKERWLSIQQKAIALNVKEDDNLSIISQKAFRAYPKWILTEKDNDLWLIIQRYKGNHNLSLLPEQINFLNDFRFPTYINGQAGSGKSTMLYYLFANVFSNQIAGEFEGEIVFLTENKELLEETRKSISGLLESNPDFNYNLNVEQKSVKGSFFAFNDFLLNFLPDEEKEKYSEEKYMDFAKFKYLYNKNYQITKYPAEEAWFVINTYVIGYDEKEIIEKREQYERVVVKDFRVFDGEEFRDIVEKCFPIFKKLIEEEKYWTKTTLVRNIRKFYPEELPTNYIAIFCDEAQDFTRIELRLIIQSSAYMQYDLSNTDQIPIVFAGDSLQTVSPNRFTMTRLKQMYYNIFKESNYDYNSERQRRSIYTPEFNYRSSQSIVRIANTIQQFRQKYLGEDNYIRQKSKRTDNDITRPILHYKEWLLESKNFETYKEKFKYKSFIVPMDLNEEDVYVGKEDLLSSKGIHANKYFTDIKTSINAKGAEYSQVVVYGFGDYYYENFGVLPPMIGSFNFKLKFFFNKLYVAITRAQNELIIIDSKNGSDSFWRPLFSMIKGLSSSWETYDEIDDIIWISPDTGLERVSQSTKEDALENARKDKEQGVLDKNGTRLKVAASTFQILGYEKEANECLGYSALVNKKWDKAGDYFKKAENLEKASDAYFRGKVWHKIPRSIEGNTHKARTLIANLMTAGIWGDDDIKEAYDIRGTIYEILNGINWYEDFSEKLIEFIGDIKKQERKRDLAIIASSVTKDDDKKLWNVIANLYYETNQFEKSISSWDKYIYQDNIVSFPENYLRAKIEIAIRRDNKIKQVLWQGRLLADKNYLTREKRFEVAEKFFEIFQEANIYEQNLDYQKEVQEYLLLSYVILGKKDDIHNVAKIIEENTSNKQLSLYYKHILLFVTDESIAFFIKERLAYCTFQIFKNKNVFDVVNYDIAAVVNKQLAVDINKNTIWTASELEALSKEPQRIRDTPSDHIKNIIIENYRIFKKIEINNIGNYNLILGDNNAGKTTLLEALLFSITPNEQYLNIIYTHNLRRNNNEFIPKSNIQILDELKNNTTSTDQNIIFTIAENKLKWEYTLRHPTLNEIRKEIRIDDTNPKDYIVIKQENSNSGLKFSDHVNNLEKDTSRIPFVPYGKGYTDELSDLYFDLIGHDRRLREEFRNCIKKFIPNILEVVIPPDGNSIFIEESTDDKGNFAKSPLYNYGEGANKLFRILVQLYASKGKRLMIDEIDAGIHYSRFKDFWRIILLTAKDLDVQLFVTTHNEECIQYFHEVLLEEELSCCRELSRIITLEYLEDEDRIIPIVRNFDSMDYAIEHDLEIRGNQ